MNQLERLVPPQFPTAVEVRDDEEDDVFECVFYGYIYFSRTPAIIF